MLKLATKIQLFIIGALLLTVTAAQASFTVPIRSGGTIHFVWVGDLNGDGKPDYVVDRCYTNPQKIEAYTDSGTFLWEVNFGPNSANQDNISPGSATIDVGHNDGVTVSDVNGDGKAEVIIKFANGVTFGNGVTWSDSNNNKQWIGVLNGATGALLASCQVPTDYLSVGPVSGWLGVGNCGIVFFAKNRNSDGSFNQLQSVFTLSGSSLTLKWKKTGGGAVGHAMRIVDVNGDGIDDICHIGFAYNGSNGAVLYTVSGVAHGDRFHIAKMDPNRAGLQGYGIQQSNPNGLREYYYDAGNGSMIWAHYGAVADLGRGDVGDLDANYAGYEAWTFDGVNNAPSNTKICAAGSEPWPSLRLWWDTYDLRVSYNDAKIEEWDPTVTSGRKVKVLYRITDYASDAVGSDRGAPMFYGDFLGDWREEVIVTSSAYNKLYVLTPRGTSTTRPNLWNDRYYRNCLTVKGYMQSHHTSYYIGSGGGGGSDTLLSQGKAATASSFQTGNEVAKGNDGSLTTRWGASSSSYPQWWRVDLGSSRILHSVTINWYNSSSRSYKYRIEVSSNGSTYTTVVDKTGNTATGDTTDTFTATGRYVRVTVTGASAGWASFYECKVYGQ